MGNGTLNESLFRLASSFTCSQTAFLVGNTGLVTIA